MKIILRRENVEENTIAIINVPDWGEESWEFMHALKKALTYWFKNNADGRRAWIYEAKKKFTIEHLASYVPDCFMNGGFLGRIFKEHGINFFSIELVSDLGNTVTETYDTILVSDDEAQEV